MQNKHYFFFSFLGIPTFGEVGGVKPVGPKSQLLPKICFWGFPNRPGANKLHMWARLHWGPFLKIPTKSWCLHLAQVTTWCLSIDEWPAVLERAYDRIGYTVKCAFPTFPMQSSPAAVGDAKTCQQPFCSFALHLPTSWGGGCLFDRTKLYLR